MTMHSVKIKMHGQGRGTVELDGKPVPACTAFECIGRVGEANVLKLTLLVKDVEIDGVYDVTTIENTARAYERISPADHVEDRQLKAAIDKHWGQILDAWDKRSPGITTRLGLRHK